MEVKKQMQATNSPGRQEGKLRILEIIGSATKGGMENYIKDFIAHLSPGQFQLTCICPCESPFTASLRQLGVEEVYITPIADDPEWRSIQLAVEVTRLHQIDILHAHMPKAHVLAGIAGCLVHRPVVATLHGMHVTSHELGITRAVGSHLITNCQETYTQALAMGIPAERVDLVRNGVNTDAFTPSRRAGMLRKATKVSQDTPLVGFVGRLEHEKGPDLFVRAAQYIHFLRPDVHFVIAGDGSMLKQLKKMCTQMRLEKLVHFVGWQTNTPDIYHSLDILAHTSRSDGTSLVLLEAMSCACPVVGLAVGGVREIIENERTGMLADGGDCEGLATEIIKLLEQPECLAIMGAAARLRVEQYFNIKTNTQRTSELLRHYASSVLNGKPFSGNNKLFTENSRQTDTGLQSVGHL